MDSSSGKQGVIIGSVALVLIAAVIAGGYYVLNKKPGAKALPIDTAYTAPDSVLVAHTQKGATHTFSGTIPMSSTCNKIASGVSYDERKGVYEVSLALGVLVAADGHCEGVADGTTQSFSVNFTPKRDLPVKLVGLTVNGKATAFTPN